MVEPWRKCSSCKKDILLGQNYYICSVSTCRGNATNYAFCSIACWDAHVPVERHRPDSAGAIEKQAPKVTEVTPTASPTRKIIPSSLSPKGVDTSEEEILVVVTKVRKYIADRSGMNTSAGVYVALTEKIKRICDLAIEEARAQGRKTVMDKDFP